MAERLFVFLQLEFPWELGPADGRYLLRADEGGDAEHVVVFDHLSAARDAPRRSPRRGPTGWAQRRVSQRPRPTTPDPVPVSTARVTVIDPVSLSAEHQARTWLEQLDHRHYVQDGLEVVNRVIALHRVAAADPYVREVSALQALVIRAGWGEGEQVADGRWLHARELPAPAAVSRRGRSGSRERTAALRPQERLAALLGARNDSLVCEELVLRARLDLDHGRLAHAALQGASALRTGVRELAAERRQDLALRLSELEQLGDGIDAQAQAVLDGHSDRLDEDAIRHAIERLEAALRARTAPGFSLR